MYIEQFVRSINASFTEDGLVLIYTFFISFSRFENALLNAGYSIGVNNRVIVDWDKFSDEVNATFRRDYSVPLSTAVAYLVLHPPMKQSLRDNVLIWRTINIPDQYYLTRKLSILIRTVRNNLFHGGKFVGNFEPDISRNYQLINSCIIILDEWLRLKNDVREIFLSPLEG